ncbi:MAG: insulinase family protein, partial [Deltaproteobacteria bacterium]|nr:insulinase family protein [Deltaproteobacteria bacterium]
IVFSIAVFFFAANPVHAGARDITKTTLDNGLTVILEEDRSAPVVAFQMWVRVGSADEAKGEEGLAHVFEHMLFKGTGKRGVGEIAKEIEASGGSINAYTSYDNTVYHLAVGSRFFSTGLDIISDAIQHSSFDPDELRKELDVVLEELRMNEDSPERKLYKSVFSTAFSTHPYKRPVIGYEETVRGVAREKVLDFFSRWYIPNNMTLVVAGDFNKDQALKDIKESFRDFEKRPDLHKERPAEPVQASLKTSSLGQPITTTHMALAFHIPGLKSEDTYALDVIAGILGDGVTSRLYKSLKVESDLVHGVSAYAMSPKDPGLFFITATLDSGNVNKTIEKIVSELEKLSSEGPSARELEKIKLSLESDFVYSRETMEGKAEQLGYYETVSGDLAYEEKYIEGLRKVAEDYVKGVVKKYFTPENMTISAIVPEREIGLISSGSLNKTVKDAEDAARKAFPELKERETLKKVKLENGVTLIVKEDHSNPTVAFYATFPGGLRFETPGTNGMSNFISKMLMRGTTRRTREELASEIEDMSGGVLGFSGWNSTGVSAKFLSRFFERGLDIFADVIENPSFPGPEIEKLRKDVLAAIKREEDYLPGYTFKLVYKELFRKHPYGMPINGTEKTVKDFKSADLKNLYERLFAPERMVLSIVGDVNADYTIEKAAAAFKDFKARKKEGLPELTEEKPPAAVIKTGKKKEKEQANIAIGFIGPRILDRDFYALTVLDEVLSSQGGRLFIELRDRQSLAYAVSAFIRPGVEPGLFGIYIGCEPSKKERAIEGILRELKKTTEEKVTEEELKRAKNSLVGG